MNQRLVSPGFLLLVTTLTFSSPGRAVPAQRQSVCLNGVWEQIVGTDLPDAPPNSGWTPARVPGLFRTPFRWEFSDDPVAAIDAKSPGPESAWYRLSLPVPADWDDGRRVEIAFNGVHYSCSVWLDGQLLGRHEGAHSRFSFDISSRVGWGEHHVLAVKVYSAPAIDSRDRFSRYAGIWRDVYLNSHPPVHATRVFVMPSVRRHELTTRVWVCNGADSAGSFTVDNAVYLRSRRVLSLPPRHLRLAPGETGVIDARQPWRDAILWGFGEYGSPTLYSLETRILDSSGRLLDRRFTRFGFREFWTEGRRFIFNSKPFLIKGDLLSPGPAVVENREFITQYFRAERSVNVNFIRLHCAYGFTHDAWFDTADELGMMLEVQQYLAAPSRRFRQTMNDQQRQAVERRWQVQQREWREWLQAHWNHPSIVMISTDNEAVSQADWGQPPAPGKPHPVWADLDRLHHLIRDTDPTRLIESQGNVGLGTAHAAGIYQRLEVFNVHPYGDPLGVAMDQLLQRYQCPPDIPVHVGEVYGGPDDPFNWWTRPAEMLRLRRLMWDAYDRQGKYLARSIRSVVDHGAAGVSLCAGTGRLFIGFGDSPDDLALGPWQDELVHQDEDFSDPKVNYGRGQAVNMPAYPVSWPSLSGAGMKVRWLVPGDLYTRLGSEFNFFDPTRPPFNLNIAARHVHQAFHDLDGKDVGPLSPTRAAEVVVRVPRPHLLVFAGPLDGQPTPTAGVRADGGGTAWFVLWLPGRYRFSAPQIDTKTTATVSLPPLGNRAGYGHIQWISLAGADTDALSRRLETRVHPRILRPTAHPANRADENRLVAELFDRNGGLIILDRAVFEYGTRYTAARPGWIAWVGCRGGRFDPRARCYRIPAEAPQYAGTIRIGLRPDLAPPVIRLTVDAVQQGYLYVQLTNSSGKVVCNNLTGRSILTATGKRESISLNVPLKNFPDTTALALRRYHGPIEVHRIWLEDEGLSKPAKSSDSREMRSQ